MTFLLSLTSVNMEWTRQVLENIAPKAKLNPAMRSHARAVQTEYKNSRELAQVLKSLRMDSRQK